jgi:hypothetical protein
MGHDVFAEAAIDVCRLLYAVVEELYPLLGRFVMRHRVQQIVSLNDDFESIAQIVRQTPDFRGLFWRDGGCIWRHSDLGLLRE